MISLSDEQLRTVMEAARSLQPGRRDLFLQRVDAMLRLRHRFTDADVAGLALCGLVHHPDTAARSSWKLEAGCREPVPPAAA